MLCIGVGDYDLFSYLVSNKLKELADNIKLLPNITTSEMS